MSNSHVALSLLEQVNMLYNRVSPSIESCASRFRNNFYKVSMRANYVLLAPTTAVAAALLLRDALKMSRSSLSAMQLYITRKYPLRGYILGVPTHTTAWDRLWGGDVF